MPTSHYFDYDPSGSIEANFQRLLEAGLETSFQSSANGSYFGMYQTALSRFDRFGQNHFMPNTEKAGMTFITRPKLNLSTASLRQDAIMSTLATLDSTSIPFSIRCYLDSEFATRGPGREFAEDSPFVANNTPFILPLTNCLISISGYPDPVLDTETTEGGFFSEDQTFAKGSDFLRRSYDLSLTFKDIQGGYVLALFYYWIWYISLVTNGIVTAYPEDIDERVLCYTCSIYRFLLDPTLKYITKWSKATGSFPKSVPMGNSFNFSEREAFISANMMFTIPFQVNKFEYMNPMVFYDFNTIMEEYAGQNYYNNAIDYSTVNERDLIDQGKDPYDYLPSRFFAPNDAEYNYRGIPWIDTARGMNELKWVVNKKEIDNSFNILFNDLSRTIEGRIETIRARQLQEEAVTRGIVSA